MPLGEAPMAVPLAALRDPRVVGLYRAKIVAVLPPGAACGDPAGARSALRGRERPSLIPRRCALDRVPARREAPQCPGSAAHDHTCGTSDCGPANTATTAWSSRCSAAARWGTASSQVRSLLAMTRGTRQRSDDQPRPRIQHGPGASHLQEPVGDTTAELGLRRGPADQSMARGQCRTRHQPSRCLAKPDRTLLLEVEPNAATSSVRSGSP